jgi:hypothetical protein
MANTLSTRAELILLQCADHYSIVTDRTFAIHVADAIRSLITVSIKQGVETR